MKVVSFAWCSNATSSYHPLLYRLVWMVLAVDISCIVLLHLMLNHIFRILSHLQPHYHHEGLHRSKDPGVTGFTGFHDQKMITLREIPAGGEIFVDYGESSYVLQPNYTASHEQCQA